MSPVVTVVASVAGLYQQRKAVKAQERAAQAQAGIAQEQARQQEVAATASRRRTVREAQLRRARALASAEALGATGSSAVGGGFSSLSSQLAGGLGYQTQMTGISRNISGLSQQAGFAMADARKATGMANLFGGLAQFSQDLTTMSQSGGSGSGTA